MKSNQIKDNKSFSRELQLLLLILTLKNEDETILSNIVVQFVDVDWHEFVQLSIHHRVFPVIYKKLQILKQDSIPAQAVTRLRSEYQKNVFRMLQLSGETEQLAKIFTSRKIRTLFLKGPVLATHLYGEISLRTSSDLDILIPIHDLERAEQLLESLGYQKDDYIVSVLNDWKWRHHHITFFHPQKKIKVEIHWRLNPGPAREPSFEALWKRKSLSSNLNNNPVYMLGNEDLFLFLVSHGARHGWSRLRWLYDIHILLTKDIDWKAERKLLRHYGYSYFGGQAINLCKRLLNTKIPNEIKSLSDRKRSNRLAESALFYIRNIVNLHSEPLPKEVASYHKKHLFLLMSSEQKLLYIASFLFPYPEDARILPMPKFLHFLYFPLRPFLWAWRRTKRQPIN